MDWIEQRKDGVVITLHVSPNAKKSEIVGYDEWRRALEVKVSAPAKENRANAELVSFLKKLFGRDVKILSGEKSRTKKVLIVGAKVEEIAEHVKR